MMSKKKKVIVSVCLVFLLFATVYVNLLLSKEGGDSQVASNYFTEYRSERQTTRQEQLLSLDAIINNSTLEDDVVASAVDEKLLIVSMMDQELSIESLIQAKGFEDVVVTMNTNSDNINVIVQSSELTQEDVAKIYEVIASTTNATYSNVKIIPIE